MSEFRIFKRLVEVYAKVTQRDIVLTVRPNGAIQLTANGINLNLGILPYEKWVEETGKEIYRNLEERMKAAVPKPQEIILTDEDLDDQELK